jgi:hypothetical protein
MVRSALQPEGATFCLEPRTPAGGLLALVVVRPSTRRIAKARAEDQPPKEER